MPDLALAAAGVRAARGRSWRVRKDGTRFWANVVITALRDDAGKLLGFGKVTRDLNRRMKATERLKDSEARLLALTNHGPCLMFIKDLEGRYQYVNDQFCRSVGWSSMPCWPRRQGILPPNRPGDARPTTRASSLQEPPWIAEAGYCRDSAIRASPASFRSATPMGALPPWRSGSTDIKERKRIERDSRKARTRRGSRSPPRR